MIKKTVDKSNDLKFTLIQSLEQIEAVRNIWQKMQNAESHPAINADIDRYLSVLKASQGKSTPLILLLEQKGLPKAMVIGRREEHTVGIKIGYKTIFNPKLNSMAVVYGGILGDPDEDTSLLIIKELKKLLKRKELNIDLVYFNHLKVESIFYRQIRENCSLFFRNHFPKLEEHWRMPIPDSIENFYASRSKKHRKHLRQYRNAVERDFENVKMCTYKAPQDLSRAMADASAISKKTYQSGIGAGFNNSLQRQLLKVAAEKGWFRGHILYLNEKPASYRFALCYKNTYFGDGIGFDPAFRKYRIGTLLFLDVLGELCKDGLIKYYDFGFGDAEYKGSYSNEEWLEAGNTYLFAFRIYPLLNNLIYTVNSVLILAFQLVFKKTGMYNSIKRKCRNFLQKKQK